MEQSEVTLIVTARVKTLEVVVDALINARTNASGDSIDTYQNALDDFVGMNYQLLRQYDIITNEMEEAELKLKQDETGTETGQLSQ